jgi:MOSC domain-containing protein YiiM
MEPGARLAIGGVLLELTSFANPCRNIAPFFRGEGILRVSQRRHPGWSRMYARVLKEGAIAVGDGLTVL